MLAEERDYFLSVGLYYQGRDEAMVRAVADFKNYYSDSPRIQMLNYLLAHSLIRMGRRAEAIAVYPAGRNFSGRGKSRIELANEESLP